MNSVILIGRLARDPELSYTPNTQNAVCRMTVAVDRPRRNGEDQGADFIRVTVWGRQGENCDRFLSKGRQVAVRGRIQTGSYTNRDGQKVYTTEVVADNVEFLGSGNGGGQGGYQNQGGIFGQGGNSGYNQGGSYGGGNGGYSQGGYSQSSYNQGGQNYGASHSGQGGFGGSQAAMGNDAPFENDAPSAFETQGTGFDQSDSDFGGFDDMPDTFQAAQDDIPF